MQVMYASDGNIAANPRHSKLTDGGIIRKIAAPIDIV